MRGDDRRILLLAAEPAARLHLHDAHAIGGQAEDGLERLLHVVGALKRAEQRDAIVFRHGDHAVRLDVGVLLVTHAVFALDDEIRRAETGLDVALVDRNRLEDGGRGQRIEDRRILLVLNLDASLQQPLAILMRQQQDWLRRMAHFTLGQARLVVGNQRHEVAARDVVVVHDGEARRVELVPDAPDATASDRRSDRSPVDHPGEPEIVDVLRGASDLVRAVTARDAATD